MPRYINNTGDYVNPLGRPRVADGEEFSTVEYLQDHKGLTIIEHMQAEGCGKLLYSEATGGTAIEYLNLWDKLEIYNATDDVVFLQANNDSTNLLPVPIGGVRVILNRNPRSWYKMTITGSGSGNVYVMGY